jgi:biopolymer transport protein ExbD
MSAITGTFGPRAQSQDFELNLASIIDCLTVLIAFVMISTSFVSIGILDAGVAAGGETAVTQAPAPVNLTITLKADHSISLKLAGKVTSETKVAAPAKGKEGAEGKDAKGVKGANDAWDYKALSEQLAEVKRKWPTLNGAVLVADNAVPYRDVVKSMEAARKSIPAILLGGF